jgi:hypothetical protein
VTTHQKSKILLLGKPDPGFLDQLHLQKVVDSNERRGGGAVYLTNLVLAVVRAGVSDVLECLFRVDPEAVGDGADAVGTKGAWESVSAVYALGWDLPSVSMYVTLPDAPPISGGSWAMTESVCAS